MRGSGQRMRDDADHPPPVCPSGTNPARRSGPSPRGEYAFNLQIEAQMAQNGETKRYSLKEREYVGDDGQIHYHTNVYMEKHGLGSGRGEPDDEGGSRGQRASGGRGGSRSGARSGGERASGSRRGSSGRESGSAREGGSEREEEFGREGGTARAILTAAGFGLAAVAAAAFVSRRLETRRENSEPDIRPRDDHDPGRGMD
jgi:hypothetical protein